MLNNIVSTTNFWPWSRHPPALRRTKPLLSSLCPLPPKKLYKLCSSFNVEFTRTLNYYQNFGSLQRNSGKWRYTLGPQSTGCPSYIPSKCCVWAYVNSGLQMEIQCLLTPTTGTRGHCQQCYWTIFPRWPTPAIQYHGDFVAFSQRTGPTGLRSGDKTADQQGDQWMGRREWNQGLTLSPRYGNVFYVVDLWQL